MATIKGNKEVLQSYIITTAKYDFSIYEKRILYRQIEIEQELLLGNKITPNIKIETNLWRDKKYTIPVRALLTNGEDKNHARIKKAFEDLMNKKIIYETKDEIEGFPLVQYFHIDKKGETVTWQSHSKIVDAVVDFAKGFRKYELKTAMEFESVYSMRFYELLSGQTTPLTYTIEQLKSMFQIQNRYKQVNDFLRFVIEPAKKELDAKSPYSFDYHVNKEGRRFHSITFFPIRKEEVTEQQLRKYSPKKLSSEVENYLLNNIGYTQSEIEANRDLWFRATMMLPDILVQLEKLSGKSRISKNPKGWIIGAIKKMIEKIREERHQANQTIFGDN